MNHKYKNIDLLREEFYRKYPKSSIVLIDLINTKEVKLRDLYGECICSINNILHYGSTNIKKSIDKTNYFINKSNIVHKDNYIYNNTVYVNAKTKVNITCSIHGNFTQLPSSHLSGAGCHECGRSKRDKSCTRNEDDYIKLLHKKHNNNYTIKIGSFINMNTKTPHYCYIQKEWFYIRPSHALEGQKCRKCGNKLISERNKITSVGWSYSKWGREG